MLAEITLTRCPQCFSMVDLVPTSYGWRANCYHCEIRWTRLHHETTWTPERRR